MLPLSVCDRQNYEIGCPVIDQRADARTVAPEHGRWLTDCNLFGLVEVGLFHNHRNYIRIRSKCKYFYFFEVNFSWRIRIEDFLSAGITDF